MSTIHTCQQSIHVNIPATVPTLTKVWSIRITLYRAYVINISERVLSIFFFVCFISVVCLYIAYKKLDCDFKHLLVSK